jgi:DNA-binding transcriptional MocR family regulator
MNSEFASAVLRLGTDPGDGRAVAAAIASLIDDRSARGIAAAVGRLITAGDLVVDTRLPTVRDLSKALGVSPTTVSEAWQSLAAVGAIDARGRQGTFVRQPVGPGAPRRYRRVTEGPGHFAIDLSTGTPDPALLPDLGPIVSRISRQSLTSSYVDHPVLPALEARLRDGWPFAAEQITVVDGAMDALDRIAQVIVRLGDVVVVEHPTFPPLLDLLDLLGAEIVSVDMDAEGVVVEQLREALTRSPSAIFLQPRAHNPTGITTSRRRAEAIADALRDSTAVIVEDDHSGDIACGALHSLGEWLPERTVHIRSYSKSHGPDLRLAAIGGHGDVVAAVANRRLLGPGWSSRILQSVLLEMIDDEPTIAAVAVARETYTQRRQAMVDLLTTAGVPTRGADGINLWVGVADERSALIGLAARGIGAAPGEPFMMRDDLPALRLTVGLIDGPIDVIAAAVVAAAGFQQQRTGQR